MRIAPASCLLAVLLASWQARGQESGSATDVREGRDLAIRICANCHVAAVDQPYPPILRPPAASFQSIAQRKDIDREWLEAFLTTTHKGLDNPKGMPNPQLLDNHVRQVVAYLLSLRKQP